VTRGARGSARNVRKRRRATALLRRLAKRLILKTVCLVNHLFSETPAAVGIDGHWSDRYTRAEVFENASQILGPEENRPGASL